MSHHFAQLVMQQIGVLAKISDESGVITRTFASPGMRRANAQVATWMRGAGMETRVDAIGNLIGHYAGQKAAGKVLLLGSHLDTVRNAGKFDGPLGVLLAIACVENLRHKKLRLPFAVEVAGFADEEGVRYQSAYLGSKFLAGCFEARDLKRKDASGISMAAAIRNFGGDPAKIKAVKSGPKNVLGYVEVHIEQGPVLQTEKLALGIVTGIAGQTRVRISFRGRAGHAGTTPMNLREDALCAAAEFVLAVEKLARTTPGLVATVGHIKAEPGASNVIPGEVELSLDLRHAKDPVRKAAHSKLEEVSFRIAARRKIKLDTEVVQETPATTCSKELSAVLEQSVKRSQGRSIRLTSGAGHDAAVMSRITPSAMLFIRCKDGISHHPDESVKVQDVRMAFEVLNDFILRLAKLHERV
ncbi:MAG: allantoate amidohydrolase [Verrucomicrobiota bacterium]